MPDQNRCPFVILTYPRSGSTWLVSLLNQVPGITAYGEMFLPRKRAEGEPSWDADFAHTRFIDASFSPQQYKLWPLRRLRPLSVFTFLDELYDRPGTVGFKLMSAQLQRFPELLTYFLIHRVRVVHLVRKNTLDQMISQALTVQMEQAHRLAGQKMKEHVTVKLNTATLVKSLQEKQRTIRRVQSLLRLTHLPVHMLSYEDLQKGPDAFRRLCRFLLVSNLDKVPESKFVKIRRESHPAVLKNYNEVIQALQGTPFLDMVEK